MLQNRRHSLATRLGAILLGGALTAAALPMGGCLTEGGQYITRDMHTYVSRPWEPKTITLVDTRSGESIWSSDVPVGYKLVIDFETNRHGTDDLPDRMLWEIFPAERLYGDLRNEIPVPPRSARRIDMSLRPVPERAGVEMQGDTDEPMSEETLSTADESMSDSDNGG